MSFSTSDPSTRASVSVSKTLVARKGLIKRRTSFGYTSEKALHTTTAEARGDAHTSGSCVGLPRHDGNATKGRSQLIPNVPYRHAVRYTLIRPIVLGGG